MVDHKKEKERKRKERERNKRKGKEKTEKKMEGEELPCFSCSTSLQAVICCSISFLNNYFSNQYIFSTSYKNK